MQIENYISYYNWLLVFIFALGFGSFATMAIYRFSNGELWVSKKPFCTECRSELKFIDYIPILSLLYLRGKCRYCGQKYRYWLSYLATEILIFCYFCINFQRHYFSDLFILNSGFIVVSVIWSIVFLISNQNATKMLLAMLFFASLKRVLLDQNVVNIVFYGGIAFVSSLMIRHLYFWLKKDLEKSMDYLKYQPEDRFNSSDFIVIKLAVIGGIMLTNFSQILLLFLLSGLVMFFRPRYQTHLPIIANLMIVFFMI